jgi:hypothetical protein
MTANDSHRTSATLTKESRTPGGRDAREGAHTGDGHYCEKSSGKRGDFPKVGYAVWLDRAPPTASWQEVIEAIKAREFDEPADRWPDGGSDDA